MLCSPPIRRFPHFPRGAGATGQRVGGGKSIDMHGTVFGFEAADFGELVPFERLERRERDTPPRWTVVIPVFNEAGFIGPTLRALAGQTRRIPADRRRQWLRRRSVGVVARLLGELGLDGRILIEPRPARCRRSRAASPRWRPSSSRPAMPTPFIRPIISPRPSSCSMRGPTRPSPAPISCRRAARP